jgi:hypothetical protein
MSDIVLFRDYFRLIKPTQENAKEWKDSIKEFKDYSAQEVRKGLEVSFEATHAGILNKNMKFYIPSRMKDGTITFMNKNKSVKILKHHDALSDPVGIITSSEYVSTVPELLSNDKNVQIMSDSSNSITKQVIAAKNFLQTKIPLSDNWRGLGYIRLKGLLLDPKTIEQVLDGRFDAVSTSFSSPGHAYCSVCAQNWAVDGPCEHQPGKIYADSKDDIKTICGIIPGFHDYKELSLVVADADPMTSIVIGNKDSVKEFSITPADWQKDSEGNESAIVFSFRDYKEDTIMSKKKEATLPDERSGTADPADASTSSQEPVINADEIAEGMRAELKLMFDAKELTQEEFEVADAKLSSEQRNKMSESTFCGPDKSFPVPDCAHVTAARRLIGKYNGPGNKDSILACVAKKAKALGCDKSEDAADDTQQADVVSLPKVTVPTCEAVATFSDTEVKELFSITEAELLTRKLKLDRPCAQCEVHETELVKVKDSFGVAEKEIENLKNTLSVLREELRNQMSDYMSQADRYIELGVKLATEQRDHLAIIGTLSGKFEDIEKATAALNESDISEQYAIIMDGFKLEDILTKINDGMTKTPKGTIEDPSVNNDKDNSQFLDGLSPAALAAIENIRDFIKDGKLANAKQLYGKMIIRKVIDENLVSFDSLSAINSTLAE